MSNINATSSASTSEEQWILEQLQLQQQLAMQQAAEQANNQLATHTTTPDASAIQGVNPGSAADLNQFSQAIQAVAQTHESLTQP